MKFVRVYEFYVALVNLFRQLFQFFISGLRLRGDDVPNKTRPVGLYIGAMKLIFNELFLSV